MISVILDDVQETGTAAAPGVLVLAGTPIGDVADASPRLRAELAGADVIAAEDTRRFRALLQRMGVSTTARVVSYFEGNEATRTPELVEALTGGARVVVATDAGMPSVSDPGFRLVAAAVAAGIRVTAVPGPSAVLTALAVSGLPVDRFCFEGFLSRKTGERSRQLARLADTLADAAAAFGDDRPAAVCRELTKTHEEVRRGPLAELAAWAAEGVRGEITVVIAGAVAGPVQLSPAELAAEVAAEEAAGADRKEAIRTVVARTGLPRRVVYDAVVAAKGS
ncbi:MAG: rsmI [Modestobacter sp.]|nr:rsmI [Modestobacter sp.]